MAQSDQELLAALGQKSLPAPRGLPFPSQELYLPCGPGCWFINLRGPLCTGSHSQEPVAVLSYSDVFADAHNDRNPPLDKVQFLNLNKHALYMFQSLSHNAVSQDVATSPLSPITQYLLQEHRGTDSHTLRPHPSPWGSFLV
ncbi:hypothetical protein PAL_GLEAN10012134 [Pteropus alecto]|uniref:Uncharacterized protein n=1 Tax=Pteropus alecto TaxID=9402 RepID=L5KC47_PTEAL|nr:hypothetical protein PAL_GLEAN10012134 [Pteropus alecto]